MLGSRLGSKGRLVGSKVGSGADDESGVGVWTTDATSGKAMPQNATEAGNLLAAAGLSATTLGLWLFGVPASGNVSDSSGNGKTLTATGGASVKYQQNVAGWSAKAIVMTAGAAGRLDNNTFPNINATTPTLLLWYQPVAEGATRSVMRYGTLFDDDVCLEQTNVPRIQGGEGDATRTVGGSDPTGAVRPFALSCGASVVLADDQETIAVGTKAANGTMVTFGGDNTDTNFPPVGNYVLGWLIDTALSSAQIRTLFQTAGWTIPW